MYSVFYLQTGGMEHLAKACPDNLKGLYSKSGCVLCGGTSKEGFSKERREGYEARGEVA